MGFWKEKSDVQDLNAVGLRKRGRTLKKADFQTGKTTKKIDQSRKALPPGKRISRTGNVYYEYRKNRSDLNGT